ncbi:hypothetical protein OIU84_007380 [Salix udensis]|uniref:Uncharacterized protein n=1 Tax=Salix udensis TaxID=889485 RepID=A0AAD6NZE6_9ROSI|nr:hypothetical protein OIU84_007380 [Salix udensis]
MQKKLREGHVLLLSLFCLSSLAFSWSQDNLFNQAKNYEGSSDLVDLQYHMGPVLAAPVSLYIICPSLHRPNRIECHWKHCPVRGVL